MGEWFASVFEGVGLKDSEGRGEGDGEGSEGAGGGRVRLSFIVAADGTAIGEKKSRACSRQTVPSACQTDAGKTKKAATNIPSGRIGGEATTLVQRF